MKEEIVERFLPHIYRDIEVILLWYDPYKVAEIPVRMFVHSKQEC